jgi:large subunit ribosomal protein L4
MTKTAIYNQLGEKVKELDLNPKIFGIEKIDVSLVHNAVRAQQNNQRHSIAQTKNRGEVAGSGKKPWKQKGTGRARAGSVRSPLWRHGGVTFGPTSARNWAIKQNRSAFRKALFTVLTDKVNDKKLVILESFDKTAKTSECQSFIGRSAQCFRFNEIRHYNFERSPAYNRKNLPQIIWHYSIDSRKKKRRRKILRKKRMF